MAEFLVELYVARSDAAGAGRAATDVRTAAAELTGEGTSVRCLHSIFVPEDETCFVLCEADSAAAVHEAGRRAAVSLQRITEAIWEP
jgi:Protein of unknown function (DUF4242)